MDLLQLFEYFNPSLDNHSPFFKKATEFAEKGGGEFGQMFVKMGKVGLALQAGATMGGVGMALQGSLGHLGKMAAESTKMAKWETTKGGGVGGWAKRLAGRNVRTVGMGSRLEQF